ncbi:MAG TPA: MBL fold metallo-hydrolase, partial [Polyangiales bacterium]
MCVALLIAQVALNGAAPLSAPPALRDPLPPASPPAEMRLLQLPTGTTRRSAAFAYRGGSPWDSRDFVMTAVLIQHPRGDLLIDTGFGRQLERHFAEMPLYFRLTTRYVKATPAADQLVALGHVRQRLRGILLTHAHWDHASGLADFPGVPVLVTEAERRFIQRGGFLTAAARAAHARWETYRFEGGPYLGFPAHHDVHGDGSIVAVPAPGHTPGSVIIFVTLPGERRYAFVGDLAWQREGILRREERPFPQRL